MAIEPTRMGDRAAVSDSLVLRATWVPGPPGELGELLFWGETAAGRGAVRPGAHPFAAAPAALQSALAALGLRAQAAPANALLLLPSAPVEGASASPAVHGSVPRPPRTPAEGASPSAAATAAAPRPPGAVNGQAAVGAMRQGGPFPPRETARAAALAMAPPPTAAPGLAPLGGPELGGASPDVDAVLAPWRVAGLRPALAAAAALLARVAAIPSDQPGLDSSRVDARQVDHSDTGSSRAPVATPLTDEPPPSAEASRAQAERAVLPSGVALGADLRFWATVVRFALDLMAAEQVVPDLARRAGGDLRAVWRPLLAGQSERRRLRALVEAMPPVCRVALADDPDAPPIPPAELLRDVLEATIDALARDCLTEAIWPEARWQLREGTGMPPRAGRWVEALAATRPQAARLSARRSGDLPRDVAAWSGAVLGASPSFRLCLRLTPPTPNAQNPTPSARPWRLDYLLQAADDAAVLVPADRLWSDDGAVARLAGRLVEGPQEILLRELALAGRRFAPIAASLAEPRPDGVDLTVDEAYTFLRDAVPHLADEGIGVLAPPWWTRRGARRQLGVRVNLTPSADAEAPSVFGLQSLVDYDWRLALGGQELTAREFEQLVASQAPLVELRGEWVELDPEQLRQALRFWGGPGGSMPLAEALRLASGAESAGLPIEKVDATGWLADALAETRRLEELPEPPGFVGQLRPYQRRGFGWLSFMRDHRLGACLADDMGLGKTPTTIALLLTSPGPALLACPTSVLGNWTRELARFGPGLRVLVHHGPGRTDAEAFPAAVAQHDVVLTTYTLLHRDEARLSGVEWAGVVLDEAQNVKNASARASRTVRRLRTGYRLALTGTPVENRLGELWSIMEFLNPGFLGPAETFRRRFARPIEREGNSERAEELRKLVEPFILRRLKSDPSVIRDLPEKLEMKTYPPLTREQASLYEAVVQDMLAKIELAEGVERRGLILATLTKLKQVCNHPAHFHGDDSALAHRSGKLMRLEEMLEEAIAEGDHTLVFTQFAAWGGRLQAYLQERLGREVLYLYGGTPVVERDRLVQRFQAADAPPVFVLSLRAGGVGLNLTRANRVVHYDRWWNPAVEAQATDRAYRIGQTRSVQVHAFICAGTLEERIDELIESKRALAQAVIGTGEAWLTELTTDELRSVLQLRQAVIADA